MKQISKAAEWSDSFWIQKCLSATRWQFLLLVAKNVLALCCTTRVAAAIANGTLARQRFSCDGYMWYKKPHYLAATKQLYEWYFLSVCASVCPSVCLSVCLSSVRPSHLFDYVPIIVSSWNCQELSPRTRVTSVQKVKVRGQRSRSQRSLPNLTVSGL